MVKVSKFDAVDYLDSEEMMAEYLTAAMEDENTDVFLAALSDVAKARGMAQLARIPAWAGKAFTRRSHPVQSRVLTP